MWMKNPWFPILKNKLERFWFTKKLEPGWNPILYKKKSWFQFLKSDPVSGNLDQNQWLAAGWSPVLLVLFFKQVFLSPKIPHLNPVPVLKKPGSQFQFGFGFIKKTEKPFPVPKNPVPKSDPVLVQLSVNWVNPLPVPKSEPVATGSDFSNSNQNWWS